MNSTTLKRREFLLAAAGAMMPGRSVAGGRIQAALLGTQHSHSSGKLRALLDSPDYELAGVCEPDAAARANRQSDPLYKGLRWLSLQELLSDPSIQLVVVECPVWDAIRWGRNIIEANKHLHLEKPPANEWSPFRDLVEEARRKKLLLQMGYIWRFHQGIATAVDAARKGWLGEVYMVRGTINTDLGPEARSTVGRYRGGILFELGCHLVDRIVDFWGRPLKVQSWLRHDTGVPDGVADNTLAVFEYEKGLALITSSARMTGHTQHRSFELIGSDGTFLIQPIEPGNKARVCLRAARGPYKEGWQEIEMPNQRRYVGDFRDLARAIKENQPLKYSYDHELLVQETLLKACGEPISGMKDR